jgi:hypothetical protein
MGSILSRNESSDRPGTIQRQPTTPAFAAGTVAVEIGSQLWVGSFRGDRIAIIPAP